MRRSPDKCMTCPTLLGPIVLLIGLSLLPAPTGALAKDSYKDGKNRREFYGIIEARPEKGFQGEWVIGGQIFTTDAGTEFDQSEGPLLVGGCAKVKVRDGRVHEIDSEPLRDCR